MGKKYNSVNMPGPGDLPPLWDYEDNGYEGCQTCGDELKHECAACNGTAVVTVKNEDGQDQQQQCEHCVEGEVECQDCPKCDHCGGLLSQDDHRDCYLIDNYDDDRQGAYW